MSYIQESIISILRERSVRRHLSVVVCMIAVATVLAVFWSLHLNGITLASGDLSCGLTEHTHTADCYAWVPVEEGTEGNTEPEETETETGTETVTETETGIETATESVQIAGTEAVTEEETETAQVGDTKMVNGVEYVYTLICGMEEHTHTDACYESASSEEDSAVEEVTEATTEGEADETADEGSKVTAGVSEVFNEARNYLGGTSGTESNEIAVASEEETGGTTLTATLLSAAPAYYYADPVSLSEVYDSVSDGETEDYVIYTIINGSYYVLTAEGNLVECNSGTYPSGSTSGSIQIPLASDFFDAMRWNLTLNSSGTSNGTGVYDYYIQNASYGTAVTGQYLTPGTTEIISSSDTATGENQNDGTSNRFELQGDGTVVFTITCNTAGIFWVEAYDNDGQFFTTTSAGGAWPYEMTSYTSYTGSATVESSAAVDNVYTVMVTRSGADMSFVYYNSTTGDTIAECTATGTSLDEDINLHVIADSGAYSISAEYLDETTASYNNLTVGTYLTGQTDSVSLTGSFDVAYTFHNVSTNSAKNYENFILVLEDSNGNSTKVRADYYGWTTYSNGTWMNYYSDGTSRLYTDDSNYTEYSDGGISSTDSFDWNTFKTAMKAGADCTVEIKRVYTAEDVAAGTAKSDIVTITVSLSNMVNNNGNTILNDLSFTLEIDMSEYSSETLTMYLSGEYCTLSNIEFTNYTWRDAYTRYSTETSDVVLTAESDGYGWTGTAAIDSSTLMHLIGELGDINCNSMTLSGSSEWVSSTSSITAAPTTTETSGTTISTVFYLAKVREYTAWFDGTNGGMSIYSGDYYNTPADQAVVSYADAKGYCYVVAPKADVNYSTTNTRRYSYTLRGWYDIYTQKYYEPGETITISANTVLYADWVASSYSIGEYVAEYAADTVSTANFIDINVFDYNELFNIYSTELLKDGITVPDDDNNYSYKFTTSVSPLSHSEAFSNISSGTAVSGLESLNFLFFRSESYRYYYSDTDSTLFTSIRAPWLDYPANRNTQNSSNNGTTQYILGDTVTTLNNLVSLLKYLFGTDNTVDTAANGTDPVYGKTYVGSADYLFQYDSKTGYYYYDSSKNAAAYNQGAGRFYVYDYTVAADSNSSTSDFLPFNYLTYASSYSGNSKKLGTTYVNYWFGMSTEISFYLSESVESGNNKGIDGYDTTFKFSGDDDVWVFVDGKLVLDLGGVHDVVYGEIDFTKGEVVVVNDSDNITTNNRGIIDYKEGTGTSQNEAAAYIKGLEAGTHTLTFYYLERGSGQSNAAIYSNISPVYTLKLAKAITSSNDLSYVKNVTFEVYDSDSFDKEDLVTEATTDDYGVLTVNGLLPNTTYYLVETVAPEGYPLSHKYLTVYMNSDGTAEVKTYSSVGSEIESLVSDITTNAYTGTTDIDDILSSSDYSMFHLSTDSDPANGQGITKLLSYVEYDQDDNYYLLNRLSVFDAQNETYGAYKVITLTYVNYEEYELPEAGSTGIFPYRQAGITIVLVSITGLLIIAFYHFAWVRKLRAIAYKKENTKEEKKRQKCFA